jgi:DNA-binding MarR family transcriptional regulator
MQQLFYTHIAFERATLGGQNADPTLRNLGADCNRAAMPGCSALSTSRGTARPDARPNARPAAPSVDLTVLSDLLSFHVRMLSLEVNRAYDRAFADTPLVGGTGKLTALMLIATNPGISQGQVGIVLSKDRPAMVRIIDHLEQEALVVRTRAGGERRRYGLFLTAQGRASTARYMRIALDYDEAFFAVLNARERSDLGRLLRKMRTAYQAETLAVENMVLPKPPERAGPGASSTTKRSRRALPRKP